MSQRPSQFDPPPDLRRSNSAKWRFISPGFKSSRQSAETKSFVVAFGSGALGRQRRVLAAHVGKAVYAFLMRAGVDRRAGRGLSHRLRPPRYRVRVPQHNKQRLNILDGKPPTIPRLPHRIICGA